MITIRPITPDDWPTTWRMLEPVLRAGDTYSYAAEMTEQEARVVWMDAPAFTFVAENEAGELLGTYYLKPNQPGQGAHVCNCGYVVAASARGQGIASAMCEHSQQVAVRHGFRAMQYNMVVSTNTGAVRLWQSLGFAIVGTLPGAFKHPSLGYVDGYVMYKTLVSS